MSKNLTIFMLFGLKLTHEFFYIASFQSGFIKTNDLLLFSSTIYPPPVSYLTSDMQLVPK